MEELPASLSRERDALLAEIMQGFAGVTREHGVSWSETEVIDNYGSEGERRAARRSNRDKTWTDLIDDPNWNHEPGIGGFCFIDPIGFRYYIPAAMIRCIREGRGEFVGYALNAYTRDSEENNWSQLDERQRRCIARFLEFMAKLKRHQGDTIYEAVWVTATNSFWHKYADASPT